MESNKIREAISRVVESRSDHEDLSVTMSWMLEALARQVERLIQVGEVAVENAEVVAQALTRLALMTVVGLPEEMDPKPLLAAIPECVLIELSQIQSPLIDLYKIELARRTGKIVDWSFQWEGPYQGRLCLVPEKPVEFVSFRFGMAAGEDVTPPISRQPKRTN